MSMNEAWREIFFLYALPGSIAPLKGQSVHPFNDWLCRKYKKTLKHRHSTIRRRDVEVVFLCLKSRRFVSCFMRLFTFMAVSLLPAISSPQTPPPDRMSIAAVNRLFLDIYELRIDRAAAKKRVKEAHSFLIAYCRENKVPRFSAKDWVFPVRGYTQAAIGGSRGEGYRGAGAYDFFSGNSHGGHPAHDIFIRDRNFDELDDRGATPVDVLSVSGGLVICVNPAWTADSMDSKRIQPIRGGIYVWVYDPASDRLFYYAHLRSACCGPGMNVKPGDKLGEIGRTGKNAVPKRSPTHLHFMCLSFRDGNPKPVDIYSDLLRAEVVSR